MRVKNSQFAITVALVATLTLGASSAVAQHGRGGHAGGNAQVGGANIHVGGRGNAHGNVGGGQLQGGVANRPSVRSNNSATVNTRQSNNATNGSANARALNGNTRVTGDAAARTYGYPGGYYGSGYRGYGGNSYGGFGLGLGAGPYGYGNFPWYGGLGLFGGLGGLNRIFGNGIYNSGYYNNGYYGGISGYGGATVNQQPNQIQQPAEDYVPQVNTTSAKLAAGAAGHALLGITIDPEFPAAAVVRTVTPGAPAEVAGLRPGDMITAINARVVESPNDVVNLIAGMHPGDRVDIQFVRPIPRSQVKAAAPEVQSGAVAAPPATQPLPPAPPAPPSVPAG